MNPLAGSLRTHGPAHEACPAALMALRTAPSVPQSLRLNAKRIKRLVTDVHHPNTTSVMSSSLVSSFLSSVSAFFMFLMFFTTRAQTARSRALPQGARCETATDVRAYGAWTVFEQAQQAQEAQQALVGPLLFAASVYGGSIDHPLKRNLRL